MQQRDWVAQGKRLCVMLALGLVASFFIFSAISQDPKQQPQTEPVPETSSGSPAESSSEQSTPSSSESSSSGSSPAPPLPSGPAKQTAGGATPGVPTKDIATMKTRPAKPNANEARRLDQKDTSAQLPEAFGQDLEDYANQQLQWQDCSGGAQCAVMKVPLDWENPGEASLDIAVTKIPSANNTHGVIFVNPGGPGSGGADMARSIGADKYQGYDIVGWDPRGTGDSTTVKCGNTEQTDEFFGMDNSPEDDAEDKALQDAAKTFADLCRENSGALLDHLSTIENTRDLDLLRHLLDQDKLNYLGVSYGTYVGSVYAHLFPDRTGRIVLDSAVDITEDEDAPFQAEGFELAFDNYAIWCAQNSECSIGDTPEAVRDKVDQLMQKLDDNPIRVDKRELTANLGITGVALFLYASEEAYPQLTMVLEQALNDSGAMLLNAGDALNGRMFGSYDTIAYAFPATLCADYPDEGLAKVRDEYEDVVEVAPMFGKYMGYAYTCNFWTADSAPQLVLTAEGAAPILVIGTTGDSATPYEHAVSMAEQLQPARLLTYEGAGHGASTAGNTCLDDHLGKYFATGELPPEGAVCK